jgi:hypothetical protein
MQFRPNWIGQVGSRILLRSHKFDSDGGCWKVQFVSRAGVEPPKFGQKYEYTAILSRNDCFLGGFAAVVHDPETRMSRVLFQ